MPAGEQAAVDAYDGPLSALRNHVDDLGAWLAIWSARDHSQPDAHARRCASDAVDAIDAALADLYRIRQQLVSEIRDSDDASAARADDLLRRGGARPGGPAGLRGDKDGAPPVHQAGGASYALAHVTVSVVRRPAR